MSPVWIAFWVGMVAGTLAGVFVISLCLAAKRGDALPVQCPCDNAEQGRACRECEDLQFKTGPPRLPR
jgi:hypothetical protein